MVSDAASTGRGISCILPGNVRHKEEFYGAKLIFLVPGQNNKHGKKEPDN